MVRQWRRNWSVIMACIVHAIWGALLLASPEPLQAIPLYLNVFYLVGLDHIGVGIAFLFISVLAFMAMLSNMSNFNSLCMMLPQQFIVMQAAGMCIYCAITRSYPDGYAPEHAILIWTNQLWTIVGAVIHSLAIIDWHFWGPVKEA
jgi:hypothetical protein